MKVPRFPSAVLLLVALAPLSAWADDHANDGAGSTELTLGAPVAGQIEVGGDRDVFWLEAQAGRAYTAEVTQLSGGMDSILHLFSPTGQALGQDDDGAGNLASKLTFTAAVDGPHYLMVVHYDRQAGTGGYALVASGDGAASLTAAEGASAAAPAGPAGASADLALATRVLDPKLAGAELRLTSRRDGSGSYAASLTVRDAQGQTVRRLVQANRDRGRSYTDTWDGRDASGRFARPGDYRVRLEGGGATVSSTLHVIRLGVRAVEFQGAGRVPLTYHRAESWAGSAFALDNAGAAWTLTRSALGTGCLDAPDGSPLAPPAPWGDLDGPPRTGGGSLLQRGRSLPVAYVHGSVPQVEVTLGDGAAAGGQEVACHFPLGGRPIRIVAEGGQAASAQTGELAPGARVVLDLGPLSRRLGKSLLRVRFRFAYREDDGSWTTIPGAQETDHTLYSVLATPSSQDVPGGRPWVAALDLASEWLTGEVRTQDDALARVVQGVNGRLGLRYEHVQGAPAYTYGPSLHQPELDLTAFLAGRAYGRLVNCLDCASVVTQLGAQLGARGQVEVLGWDFRLNYLRGIGWPEFTDRLFGGAHSFSYHAVGTFDRGRTIHDACLSVDDDARPWSAPFQERLPMGMPVGRYRDQLSPDGFQGQALGRATPH